MNHKIFFRSSGLCRHGFHMFFQFAIDGHSLPLNPCLLKPCPAGNKNLPESRVRCAYSSETAVGHGEGRSTANGGRGLQTGTPLTADTRARNTVPCKSRRRGCSIGARSQVASGDGRWHLPRQLPAAAVAGRRFAVPPV